MKTLLTVAAFFLPVAAFSQDVISAKAGMINQIDGRVLLQDEPLLEIQRTFLHMEAGQRLRTEDGRAEVLFAVGSFLRIAPHSEIEMVSAGLTSACVRLHQGSMIVDAHLVYDEDSLTVLVGEGEVHLLKKGLYRLDALGAEGSSLTVVQGNALLVSDAAESTIKKKRSIRFGNPDGVVIESRFKHWQEDGLTAWHAKRASVIAQTTTKNNKRQDQGDSQILLSPPGILYGTSGQIYF
ncbi:MAG: hypothetical protein OXH92_13670 [Bryobacterales bacterium]|nr:hypothetical protein [Bryobacterales bacterium]MDE0435046.1 hypothetical protein [Bryobacterales bacterium]